MKLPYLAWKLGDEGVSAMKAIKSDLDPKAIMNPSKIFVKDTGKRMVIHS
jgi:glycolate oxidase